MKVMFLFQGLPHYYNFVLSKLNDVSGLEIINVVSAYSDNMGAGVHQTDEGANFKIIKLAERRISHGYYRLKGLSRVIMRESPDIIVAVKPFVRGFIYYLPFIVLRKIYGIKLIMKDIPFMMRPRNERKNELRELRQKNGAGLQGTRWFLRIVGGMLLIGQKRSGDKGTISANAMQRSYEKAAQIKAQGQFQAAIKMFEEILGSCGQSTKRFKVSAYYHLGDIYEKLGNKQKSKEFFKRCLALEPCHLKAGQKVFPTLYAGLKKCAEAVQAVSDTFQVLEEKHVYNAVDAHVNYVEDAFRLFSSFDVPKKKIFVTYNSPDTDRFLSVKQELLSAIPPVEKKRYRLIHVGRLVAWKRVDMLIRSFKDIRDRFPEAELLVVGYGPEEEKLKKLSSELGLAGQISFVGGVYDPYVLGRYLLSSTIYVLAGMGGISINEAMCFGLPVICSVGDGTEKKLVRDGYNGFFFNEGDQDDLTEKITRLLLDEALVRSMGQHSEAIIRNEINIHTVVRGYINAFGYARGERPLEYKGNSNSLTIETVFWEATIGK
jgi:glycosyltransferase involved in cell wall biosynthesis